jgi:hypothetical protein
MSAYWRRGRTDEQPCCFEAEQISTKEWCVGSGGQADKHKGMQICFLFGAHSWEPHPDTVTNGRPAGSISKNGWVRMKSSVFESKQFSYDPLTCLVYGVCLIRQRSHALDP